VIDGLGHTGLFTTRRALSIIRLVVEYVFIGYLFGIINVNNILYKFS